MENNVHFESKILELRIIYLGSFIPPLLAIKLNSIFIFTLKSAISYSYRDAADPCVIVFYTPKPTLRRRSHLIKDQKRTQNAAHRFYIYRD